MNIKTRIKKLEKSVIPAESFCLCFRKYCIAQINAAYDNVPVTESFLPEGDFCERCKKKVSDKDLEMQRDLQLIYGDL